VGIRKGPPIDSRLLIHRSVLDSFQNGDPNRFSNSLSALQAWSFVDLPNTRTFLKEKYRVIGRGSNRQAEIELSRGEIEGLQNLPMRTIPLRLFQTIDLESEDLADPLIEELARVLSGLRSRAQQGGIEVKRIAPVRTIKLNMADLKAMWAAQNGKCGLCNGAIPLSQTNSLLKISADRINSENGAYDSCNTHLTHLG
jgi:hypothetical protein